MTTNDHKARLARTLMLAGVLAAGPRVTLANQGAQPPSPEAVPSRDPTPQPVADTLWDLHEAELGTQTGDPLDSGFVFYNSQFLEPPYIVSRKGMGIFINGKMVQPPFMKWPVAPEDLTLGDVDPPLPPGLSATTDPCDRQLTAFLKQKSAYLAQRFSRAEASARMIAVYRSLPCVAKIEAESGDLSGAVITWTNGSVENIGLLLPLGRRIRWDKPTLLAHLDDQCRYWETRLGKGDVYFFWDNSGPYTGGPAFVEDTFPKLLRILRSTSTPPDKIAALVSPEGGSVPPETAARLVEGFSAPSQLEERMAAHTERFRRERDEKTKQAPPPPAPQPAPNAEPSPATGGVR